MSQHQSEQLENMMIEAAARIITGLRRNSLRHKLYVELVLEIESHQNGQN